MRRRDFVRVSGIIGVGALAGCSGDGGNETPEGTEPGSTTDEEQETTGTANGTEVESKSSTTESDQPENSNVEKYEDTESEAEVEGEKILSNNYLGWIEFEKPSEQIPQENFSIEEYPSLATLVSDDSESSEANFNIYEDDFETVYLMWLEDGDLENDGRGILVQGVENFDSAPSQDYSGSHTNQGADIEGIFRNVVNGYTDVDPELDGEYAEILGVN